MSDGDRRFRSGRSGARVSPAAMAAAALTLCMSWSGTMASAGTGPAAIVVAFVEAFNRHDVEAMIDLAHPDILWMSVDGESVATEASGHAALRSAMIDYFRDVPGAVSEIDSISASGRFVQAVERASRDAGDSDGARCSLSVYEVRSGLIENVWYFPAHACDMSTTGN